MKTVLITGGSRGIGAACAREFAKKGYAVAINYNNSQEKAKRLATEIFGKAYKADVKNYNEVNKMIDEVIKDFGKIDVLVNNCGIAQQKLFTDITEDDWDLMLDTNLKGVFIATKSVLPNMIKNQKGSIINISSMWGQVGASCEVHYSASKAGIIGLTKALAKEVAPSNIRVNCICPGVVDTDMNSNLTNETMLELKSETPLGKIGRAEDIANSVVFFAENESNFITGQILGVNGGLII